MQHPDPLTDALYGGAPGTTRPFLAGLAAFGALEAVRGDDGVWNVVLPLPSAEEGSDER